MSCHALVACNISAEKQLVALMEGSLVTDSWFFSLAAFRILSFNFCHFNYDISWCGSVWVHFVWDPLCFLYMDPFPSLGLGSFHP